jgi:hypothetical protein
MLKNMALKLAFLDFTQRALSGQVTPPSSRSRHVSQGPHHPHDARRALEMPIGTVTRRGNAHAPAAVFSSQFMGYLPTCSVPM